MERRDPCDLRTHYDELGIRLDNPSAPPRPVSPAPFPEDPAEDKRRAEERREYRLYLAERR